jgi:hypothetical protein
VQGLADRQDLKGVEACARSSASLLWIGEYIDRDVEHFRDSFEHRQPEQGSLTTLDLVYPARRPAAEVSELLAGQATPQPPPCHLPADFQASGHVVVYHDPCPLPQYLSL